jgi:hypothetical protein
MYFKNTTKQLQISIIKKKEKEKKKVFGGFLRILRFPPPIKPTATIYN